jgi:beta-glucosidase
VSDRIRELISQMTLEEKISLLAGVDWWRSMPIPRLGIPSFKVSDGPIGARGVDFETGPTSDCFPCGTALAATWNPALIERVGQTLAEDTRDKGAHMLLAPTVNIHRSPLAGRNFECYSEDPYLTAQMAIAYIQGLQSKGVGACIKHFVCNDSEVERRSMSSEVAERPLRELYLRPFQIAIREAKPWAVMSSYNRINGTYACENPLLVDVLKGEWGFDGLVMSDWFGTYGPDIVAGGLDLEMPGPTRWMGQYALDAVQQGRVSEAAIDDKLYRLLLTMQRTGALDQPELQAETSHNRPAHRQVARQAATEAVVLLKNERAVLPLDASQIGSIAVIGAPARWPAERGGGSTRVNPHYVITPLDAIRGKAGAKVEYAIGCNIHKMPLRLDAKWLEGGIAAQYYPNKLLQGQPVSSETLDQTEVFWLIETTPRNVQLNDFSGRFTSAFRVPESATYEMSLSCVGQGRLFVDGKQIINLWDEDTPTERENHHARCRLELSADRPHPVVVEYASEITLTRQHFRIGCQTIAPPDAMQQAVDLAARSDVALVFAGLTGEWESEGFDRVNMDLPGEQKELIERVAAANPNTVVVLNAGSPLQMDWLDRAAAVVQAWYLGQETGSAVADVLFGDANPSGRLPTTFPKRLQDNPAYINYPGENGKVYYGEGLFVGYRYYDKKQVEPLFPFGHGLSYTTFAYSHLALSAAGLHPGETLRVQVDVRNTGQRAGKETVQLYVRDVQARLVRPEKELRAFAQVELEPGEVKTVAFTLDQEALSYYDPAEQGWVAEPGEFEVLVGSSSRDIRLSGSFCLKN